MPKLENLTVTRELSGVLSRKYIKLDSLLADYADMLSREADIDAMGNSREARRLLDDLYHEMKCTDTKIGKIWDTLTGEQQVELWNNTREDLRFLYNGF